MMFMIARLVLMTFSILQGKEIWNLTEEYIEKGGPANLELALKMLPYCRVISMVQRVASALYFAACLKWPRLIKWVLYFEMLDEVINVGLPLEIENSKDVWLSTLN